MNKTTNIAKGVTGQFATSTPNSEGGFSAAAQAQPQASRGCWYVERKMLFELYRIPLETEMIEAGRDNFLAYLRTKRAMALRAPRNLTAAPNGAAV